MSNVKQTPEQKQKKIESMQTEKKFGHATVLSGIFEQIMSPAMDQKVLSDYMNKLKEHVGPGNILQMNKTPGIYSDIHSNKIEWYLRTEEKGIEGTDLIFAARIIGEHGGVKHIALQVNKEGALEISEDPVKVKMIFEHPEESDVRVIERKFLGDSIGFGGMADDPVFDKNQLKELRQF